jgi:hypothetical protein
MILFEKKNRTYLEPALHNENTFDYYDRSARKDVAAVRKVFCTKPSVALLAFDLSQSI